MINILLEILIFVNTRYLTLIVTILENVDPLRKKQQNCLKYTINSLKFPLTDSYGDLMAWNGTELTYLHFHEWYWYDRWQYRYIWDKHLCASHHFTNFSGNNTLVWKYQQMQTQHWNCATYIKGPVFNIYEANWLQIKCMFYIFIVTENK